MQGTELLLRVERVSRAADGVVLLDLVDAAGRELPEWDAGSHLEVVLPSGLIRHYSLCGDPADRHTFTVAVLRVGDGRGGSIEIHDTGLVGRELLIRGPRSHFALVEAESYLLLAGGIGVTPLVAMARELQRRGRYWRCVYGGRTATAMAFRAELLDLGGDRIEVIAQDEVGLPDFAGAIGGVPAGSAVYCCGPDAMIRHVESLCADLDGKVTLHVERFGGSTEPVAVGQDGDTAFEVELRRKGVVIQVGADQTVLEAVQEVVTNHPYSCLEGECGSCETVVLAGEVEHRDEVLSDAEKAANGLMMICVSRAKGRRLVLDI